MQTLQQFTTNLDPGPIQDTTQLETVLASSWDDLNGDDEGMTGDKLFGRMENARWEPPNIDFSIERHGGTFLGQHGRKSNTGESTSSRAKPHVGRKDTGSFVQWRSASKSSR